MEKKPRSEKMPIMLKTKAQKQDGGALNLEIPRKNRSKIQSETLVHLTYN